MAADWTRLAREIAAFPDEVRELSVTPTLDHREIRDRLRERFPFTAAVPLDEVAAEVSDLLRHGLVHVTSPRYFGLFNPSVREAGVVGDTLAALYNPQLAAASHAPAEIEIEGHTLRALAGLLGLPGEDLHATFTTGGAEANLTALAVALAWRFPQAREAGLTGLGERPAIYLSGESHHSFAKAALMCGLGTGALRRVPVTAALTLDPEALAARIEDDREAGWCPALVVATAGTTGAGAIDPLGPLAEVAAAAGAWLHVDAAWGGLAALTPRLRPLLAGIEAADSVTWDAHKGLSVPMGAGMFFCRHPAAVDDAFGFATPYMPSPAGEGITDPYATTVQWSRRAIGLKVFTSLAELGLPGYAGLIEHQVAMGDRLRALLVAAGWRLANDTPLPLVCFTHPELEAAGAAPADLLPTIYRRGRAWVSEVFLGDARRRALRACITSFRTEERDLEVLVEELETARREALAQRTQAAGSSGRFSARISK
ncbi:MAG TPA: pyridoxal-dependent decarboxylase [Thermoanaerobaculia bacterium]|nr:pyridoxal-dependent decarboxylase [Thermoanaerobaculia bacterium]